MYDVTSQKTVGVTVTDFNRQTCNGRTNIEHKLFSYLAATVVKLLIFRNVKSVKWATTQTIKLYKITLSTAKILRIFYSGFLMPCTVTTGV